MFGTQHRLLFALVAVGLACGGKAGGDAAGTTGGDDLATTLPTLGSRSTSTGGSSEAGSVSSGEGTTGDPSEPPSPPWEGDRTVAVHLFEWPWASVAEECERVLGPVGFSAVQVSPPQEHPAEVEGNPWWDRYQPVSYILHSRGGDEAAFADMVQRCTAVGVDIWVDAIVNHMGWGHTGVGFAGTRYAEYDYPDLYGDEHFHPCRDSIENWDSLDEVQTCELFGLPDLDTSQRYVQGRLTDYLRSLTDLGVAGFRIDAAKHVSADELATVLSGLPSGTYIAQEVIADATIPADMYFSTGDVTEFGYGWSLSNAVRDNDLGALQDLGPAWGLIESDRAMVFVDNHDTQRGHGAGGGVITHKEPELYRIATAFMLAFPYGKPKVMSSFVFDGDEERPPTGDGGYTSPVHNASGDCGSAWVCEHRWPSTLAAVELRNRCHAAPVSDWTTDGPDHVSFAREGCGFIALNRDANAAWAADLPTSLPPGDYEDTACDSTDCVTVTVNDKGVASLDVPPASVLILHEGRRH